MIAFLLFCNYCGQPFTYLHKLGFQLKSLDLETEPSGNDAFSHGVVVAEHIVWEGRGGPQGHFLVRLELEIKFVPVTQLVDCFCSTRSDERTRNVPAPDETRQRINNYRKLTQRRQVPIHMIISVLGNYSAAGYGPTAIYYTSVLNQ